ncbi:MAG TPA: hypothetical protein VKQ32_30305 [Polyangia bacterium]|nr:hypothetical protein [Polyangia bacterium]
MKKLTTLAITSLLVGGVASTAHAVDQTVTGAGNAAAAQLAQSSALVSSARQFIAKRIAQIGDDTLRSNVHDLVENSAVCIRHRANETAASKQAVVDALAAAGLFSATDGAAFPGGALTGVLPPVLDAGSACPHLPQPFFSAPGSVFGGHHSYPGGLPIHESFNDLSDTSFAANYRRVYGHPGPGGLPTIADGNGDDDGNGRVDVDIDQSIILAAPLLHDWGKPIVFQWNADGSEFAEFNFGGNGATDNFGAAGDSRTGAHHIIGVAESMARGLSPKFVITQASAHSNPTSGNEYKVVNWLRAGAIIAHIDPVANGYLRVDGAGRLRLPAVQRLGEVDLNAATPSQVNAPVEYQLHNLSDADFTQTGPAVSVAQILLATLAPEFGFDPSDTTRYNTKYRNVALAHLSAERLYMLYTSGGLDAVRGQLAKLRARGII